MSAIIPNIASYPTPNPNPLPSHTDASQFPCSHGTDGLQLQDRSAFQLVGAAAPLSGTIAHTTNSTPYENVGVPTSKHPESILPFQCEVCNISCNTEDVLKAHKQGKKHIKNLKKLAEASASGPKMVPPPVVSDALVGELADSSVSAQKMVPVPPPVAGEILVGELEDKRNRLLQNGATAETLIYCDICNVVCNNQEGLKAHVSSKKHSAKSLIQRARTNEVFDASSDASGGLQKKLGTFNCEICKISCTSSELLEMHVAGKKHLKKVKGSGQIPNLPLTPIASQDTPPTKPVVNPESIEVKTVDLHRAEPSSLPLTPIASQDTPLTKSLVNPESIEVKTANLHGIKSLCELCGVTCDTNEMLKIHLSGKKHRKNVEKSEKLIGPNPALTTEPAETPKVIGPMQEEGKMVTSDGLMMKRKKGGSDDDVETKKQRVLQSGTASDAVEICSLCDVVCNSSKAFLVHLAGQKHAAMAVKQAETQASATGQES